MPGGLTLANLDVRIRADLSELSAKFADVGKNFSKLGRSMSSVGASLTRTVTVPLTGLAYVMARGITGAIQYGVQIDKLSRQTGLAAEQVQKLKYAAEQNHLEFSSLAKLFPMLSKSMVDGTKEQIEAFKTMGISVTDATGKQKSAYEVMLEIADFMKGPGVSAEEKMTLAKTLMGKSAADAIPFLKLGRQEIEKTGNALEKMGGIMSADTVKKMDEFNNKWSETKERLAGVWRGLASDLLPVLNRLVDAMVPLIEKLKGLIKWFMDLPPWVQGTALAMVGLSAALGPVLWYSGSLITIFTKLIVLLPKLKAALVSLNVACGPFVMALAAIAAAGGYTIMGLKKYGDAQQAAADATQKANDALTDWLLKVREATPEALRMTDMWQEQYKKATNLLLLYIQTGSEEALNKFYDYMTRLQKMAQKGIKGPEVTAGKVPTTEEAKAFEKEWIQALFGKYAYERYLLYERYNEEKKKGQDEVRLEQWIAAESARIDNEYLEEKKEKEKKAAEELAKLHTESYVKGVLERKDITTAEQVRMLEERKTYLEQLGLQETDAFTKLTETISALQGRAPITLQEQWNETLNIVQERFGYFGEYVSGIFSGLQSSLSEALSEMILGTQSTTKSLAKLWESLKTTIVKTFTDILTKMGMDFILKKLLHIGEATAQIGSATAAAMAWAVASQAMLGPAGLISGPILAAKYAGLIAGLTGPILAGVGGITPFGEGGIAWEPTLALIGERGPERITRLDEEKPSSITVNYNHYGDIKTDMDYELVKKELTDTIKNAIRGA